MVIDGVFDKLCSGPCVDGFGRFLESKIPKCLCFLEPLCGYYTPRYLKIDYWPIGLLSLVLKIAILIYFILSLGLTDEWVYNETPMGTINAFGYGDFLEGSDWRQDMESRDVTATTYCNNESHAFMESPFFNYTTPECEFIVPTQLVQKDKGQVQIITQFLENTFVGWPCSNDVNNERDRCSASGGKLIEMAFGEACLCITTRTIYPIGVDKMTVSFEHTFQFPNDSVQRYGLQDYAGSSSLTASEAASHAGVSTAVPSTIEFPTGRAPVAIAPGSSVKLHVEDL